MKAIMISIKPKYVAKILNGEKTIEIRMTMPKCDLPIDVYIYATKENDIVYFGYGCGNTECLDTKKQIHLMREWKLGNWNDIAWWINKKDNERVVAKFTLNKVELIRPIALGSFLITSTLEHREIIDKSCLTENEIRKYLKNMYGYAWYISNLVIFDESKELSEFYRNGQMQSYKDCQHLLSKNDEKYYKLTKAPQNFCYVEVE